MAPTKTTRKNPSASSDKICIDLIGIADSPASPIAWGVSSYHRLYNLVWFNNGYHAEHHYRPRVHWTEMKQLREQIKSEQEIAGTRVIVPPHALGFLDPGLPKWGTVQRPVAAER